MVPITEEALPTISFELLSAADATELEPQLLANLDDAPKLRSALEVMLAPVLRSTPDVAAAMSRKGRYLVEFTSGGTSRLKDGTLRFLQRRDGRLQATLTSQGRFSENATLAGGIAKQASNVATMVNLIALIVVQAQLVSMERSLERIESKIDEVRRQIDHEKTAAVRGRLRALRKVEEDLIGSDWTPEDPVRLQVALDQADTEFLQIEEYVRLQCEDANRKIAGARLNARWFGPSGQALARVLQGHLDRYSHHQDLKLLCLAGRTVVAHLRCRAGGRSLAGDLERELARAVNELETHTSMVKDRAIEFTTPFRSARFEVDVRRGFIATAEVNREHAARQAGTIQEQISILQSGGPERVRALIDVQDDGRVGQVGIIG